MPTDELRLSGYREALGLWTRPSPRVASHPTLRVEEIEYSSRGDRVTGRVLLPAEGGGPYPLVLLQHGLGGSAHDASIEAMGGVWAQQGMAVASIDFPLHGQRSEAKLRSWLWSETPSPLRDDLQLEFARQAIVDLEHGLDALMTRDWIDHERVGYVGFGLGARLGAAFCALDARAGAVVLALPGNEPLPDPADPRHFVGRIAPRPLLVVCDPVGSGDALHAAAEGSARRLDTEVRNGALPREVAEQMGRFLAETLLGRA
ncbi:MAG: acetylxylan esterase [Myxococcota bacterium]